MARQRGFAAKAVARPGSRARSTRTANVSRRRPPRNIFARCVPAWSATCRAFVQNFAFLYNTLGIPIAAGVLYPFFGILLSPVIAGAAMSLSSVSVIANALRLRALRR